MTPPRRSVDSGTIWEDLASHCRALRVGDRILVSGTGASSPEGPVHAGDVAAQTRFALDKIETAIRQLGGSLRDVVRTRVYVRHHADWEVVARIHGERFRGIKPANTFVQAGLIPEHYLVEIEAEAIVEAP